MATAYIAMNQNTGTSGTPVNIPKRSKSARACVNALLGCVSFEDD